jgi:hypothetical protein
MPRCNFERRDTDDADATDASVTTPTDRIHRNVDQEIEAQLAEDARLGSQTRI